MTSFFEHDEVDDALDWSDTTQVLPRTFEMPAERTGPLAFISGAERSPHDDAPTTRGRNRSATTRTRHTGSRGPSRMVLVGIAVFVALIAGVTAYSIHAEHSAAAASAAARSVASADKAAASKKAKKKKKTKKKKSSSSTASAAGATSGAAARVASASAPAKKSATSVASVASARTVASLGAGDVVVIDAGHQGHGDSSLEPVGPGASAMKPKVADGASGAFAPHDESQINLAVALKLQKELTSRGVHVIMVRTSQDVNISNSKRAAIANNAHAALFIRLHCDGISNSSMHGFSTLVPASNKWTKPIVSASAKAGRIVQAAALKATGAADRGVVNRGDLSGFNWSKVPTVLVEMGFMSNSAEDKALTTSAYQHKLAVGLANGVVSYLGSR